MFNQSSSDKELWDAILADDEKAFTLFFDRYWLRLFKTAGYYLKDEESCKEVVHNIFISIWNKRHNLVIDDFTAYLNAATRYEVFRSLKKQKTSIVKYVDDYPLDLEKSVSNEAVDAITESDLQAQLMSYLKMLPKRCAQIFLMSRVQQLKNEEIAQELGISKHTVENQLSQAIKHLQVALKNGLSLLLLFAEVFLYLIIYIGV